MELFEQLNQAQKEACKITEGPLLILAGAGSGKTRVLTYRIAHLIRNGVPPENILAITFTNKAAAEMRERVRNLIPEGRIVWVSTFHAACVRILRHEIHHMDYVNQFTIYDADDTQRLIKNCLRELNISEKSFGVKAVAAGISKFKDELLSPDEAANTADNYFSTETAKIYKLYQQKLKNSNALDFDDIITKTAELFITRHDILERYQERFKYIMVDEYQDTNTAQYHFVRLLADKYKNICVVGDDDQSIYGWRGANIRNILEFEKQYPNAVVIKLEQNYRSTRTILDCANQVIKNNPVRKDKSLWTAGEEGEKITFYNADSDYEEARYIVGEVKKLSETYADLSDFAVFYRINAASRVLEEAFVRNSIPYGIFGGVNFYGRREIKDITAYLKLINNPADSVAFERIVNVPRRGIGEQSVDRIKYHANENGMHLFGAANDWGNIDGLGKRTGKVTEFVNLIGDFIEFAKNAPVAELIGKILTDTNYIAEIKTEDDVDTARDRLENIESLIEKANDYDQTADNPTLAAFLEDISLVADIDSFDENEKKVSLMTLHNCKGLEFSCVFVAGFEEGMLPSYRSLTSADPKDLEEERRICYVGITRAKKKLYLTAAKKRMHSGNTNFNAPSRFYDEIDKNLVEVAGPWYSKKENHQTAGTADVGEGSLRVKKSGQIKGSKKQEYWQSYKYRPVMPSVKNVILDFEIGDMVSQAKYGTGEVLDINPAGADYEVTIKFGGAGIKKLMAQMARLKKVEM